MPYVILTAALVGLDQLVKYLVLQHIELGAHVPFIPHVLELTYVHRAEGRSFRLDTRALRAELGEGISLAEPEVVLWLRDYLQEQEALLEKNGGIDT